MFGRTVALALSALVCLAAFSAPTIALATGQEIDQSTFDALGLSTSSDAGSALAAPYSTTSETTLLKGSEVYVATNGPSTNRYSVRKSLDRIDDDPDTEASLLADKTGLLFGAYSFYGVSGDKDNYLGYTTGSYMSSNTTNVMSNQGNGFSGIYATSTSYRDGQGQTDSVAELRAYGNGFSSSVNGKVYKGLILIKLFSLDSQGTRTQTAELSPSVNDSLLYSGSGGVYSYFTRRYVQELDAMFEIKAVDVDGDGVDEILAYCGAYEDMDGERMAIVDMFKQEADGSYSKTSTEIDAGPASSYQKGTSWTQRIEYHPVLTIAGGNIDRSGGDEVAITVSAPTNNLDVKDAARCSVYTWDSSADQLALVADDALRDISLAKPDGSGRAMVSANCSFGTFSDGTTGEGVTALIIAGYETNNTTSYQNTGTYWNAGVRYVYLDSTTGNYVLSDYQTRPLGDDGRRIADSYSTESGHYRPVHAPLALACANLQGLKNKTDDVLFDGDVYTFQLNGGLNKLVGSMSLYTGQRNQRGNEKDKEQVWIGDVAVGCLGDDSTWRETFLGVVGVHRDDEVNGDDDYYWMDLSHFTLANGNYDEVRTSQEGVICESNRRNDTHGTFVSLCLPDVDGDSIRARYVSQQTLYTNPVVYAVLEDAPCYSDLQSAYNYIVLGGTGFGTSSSVETETSKSLKLEAGAYVSVGFQAFSSVELEAEVAASSSYEYGKSNEVTFANDFDSHAGEGDKVVVYTVPMVYYYYQVYDPTTGEWQDMILPAILNPEIATMNVSEYDKVASATEGLDPVEGNVLFNTSGDPATYVNEPKCDKTLYYHSDSLTTTNSKGATETENIEVTSSDSTSSEYGLSINGKVGAGGGLLGNEVIAGVIGGAEAGFHSTTTTTNGASFSGSVDNLPEAAAGYGFTWNLEVGSKVLSYGNGGKGIPAYVVGYRVTDVREPAVEMVNGLQARSVSSNKATLAWHKASGDDVKYVLSFVTTVNGKTVVNDFTKNGKQVVLDHGITSFEVSADTVDQGSLNPNSSYEFCIRGVRQGTTVEEGLTSKSVKLTTLPEGTTLSVTQNPESQTVLEGDGASFSAQGVYITSDGVSHPVTYRWYKRAPGEETWSEVSGGTEATLTIDDVSKDLCGTKYRCLIMYQGHSLASDEATLTVEIPVATYDASKRKVGKLIAAAGLLRKAFGDVVVSDAVIPVNPGSDEPGGESAGTDTPASGSADVLSHIDASADTTPATGDELPNMSAVVSAVILALVLIWVGLIRKREE